MANGNTGRVTRSSAERCQHNRAAAERLDAAMVSGGLSNKQLAKLAGVAESLVSRMRRGERQVHARLIEALPPAAMRAWCDSAVASSGARIIPLPGLRKCQPVDYVQAVGSVLCETGDVSVSVTTMIADGHVSPDEARDAVREVNEAIDALLSLRARLERARKTGGENLRAVGVSS